MRLFARARGEKEKGMSKLLEWLARFRARNTRSGFTCDCCECEIFDYPLHRVCARCEKSFLENTGRFCEKCGRKTLAEGICLSCKREAPAFKLGVSPFVYFGEVASLINRVKNGNRRLACYFGERMATRFLEAVPEAKMRFGEGRYAVNEFPLGIGDDGKRWKEGETLYIAPVPTTEESRRARGYNQAEELAQAVAEQLVEEGLTIAYCPNALEKRETSEQKKLSFSERVKSAEEAYRVQDRSLWKDRTVLLVDDIMTTGATGSACARRLYKAKAKEVFFLVGASLPEKK